MTTLKILQTLQTLYFARCILDNSFIRYMQYYIYIYIYIYLYICIDIYIYVYINKYGITV